MGHARSQQISLVLQQERAGSGAGCNCLQVARFVEEATDGLVLVAFGTSFQFNSWLSLVDYQGELGFT